MRYVLWGAGHCPTEGPIDGRETDPLPGTFLSQIEGEEWRMSNSNSREGGAARGRPVPGDDRRVPEPQGAELPEWLAKQLFKIFV